jgi:Protein of unknown function (DUF1604)
MKNKFKKIGTSFEDEKETTLTGRGLLPWEQKVADENTGKRKFHGAFTGGFVAGYKNTCGSEVGFTPGTFVSNRNARNNVKQDVRDFMDHEDLGEISLSHNLLQKEEKIGEKLYANMVIEEPRKRQEYGPTMPPVVDLGPKIDYFGLGYEAGQKPEIAKHKALTKPKYKTSMFKASNIIYDDEDNDLYDIPTETLKNNKIEDNRESYIRLSTDLPGFVLGLKLEIEPKYPPPALPSNYNPRTYLMSKSFRKFTKKNEKTDTKDSPAPLFSGILASSDIDRIKKLKNFVKSTDSSQKLISIDILPFKSDPIKNLRCYNFFCNMEGLEIGGISQAHLMTASKIQKEKEEFMKLYEDWKGKTECKEKTVDYISKNTDRRYEPWKPSKLLCLGFGLPQPQVNIIETKPVSNFHDRILPVIKSSNVKPSPIDESSLLNTVFGDINTSTIASDIGLKRLRSN